jgi:hypothetical protein
LLKGERGRYLIWEMPVHLADLQSQHVTLG